MRLPDFLVLGTQKAATTSLHSWLIRQPNFFFLPRRKELRFFNSETFSLESDSLRAYSSNFQEASSNQIAGEVSPDYLYCRQTPARVKKVVPDVKLVVILRNPVERAESAYLHAHRSGRVSRKWNWESIWERDVTQDGAPWNQIIEAGIYDHHIERWWKYFDSESMRFLTFSEVTDPSMVHLNDLAKWLNPAWQQGSEFSPLPHVNVRRDFRLRKFTQKFMAWRGYESSFSMALNRTMARKSSYPPMPRAVQKELQNFYEPHMRMTQELLGRPLNELFS